MCLTSSDLVELQSNNNVPQISRHKTLSKKEQYLLQNIVDSLYGLIRNSREQDHNLYKELGI